MRALLRPITVTAVLAAALLPASLGPDIRSADACDFCTPPDTSAPNILAEYESHRTAALGTLDGVRTGRTAPFRVMRVLKGPRDLGNNEKAALKLDPRITVTPTYLLVGPEEDTLENGKAIPLSAAAAKLANRLEQLPPTTDLSRRLAFLIPELRSTDEGVLPDVLTEFANAPYADVKPLAADLDPAQLVEWAEDSATPQESRGILILLTGLAAARLPDPAAADPGDLAAATAAAPRAAITATVERWMRSTDVQRLPGYDAVLAAYLFLRGQPGLATAREVTGTALEAGRPRITGLLLQALRFHTKSDTVITRADALAVLRPLIAEDAPTAAELLTADTLTELRRLEDWDSLPAVMALYERGRRTKLWMSGPVVQYLRACPGEAATKHLKTLFGIDRERERERERESERDNRSDGEPLGSNTRDGGDGGDGASTSDE